MNAVRTFFQGKTEFRVWMLLPMLLGPIADYYLMEAFVMNPFVETRWRAQILNILFYELVMLALFFVIGKLSIALEAETVFFAIVGLTNYAVLEFRSTPIVPWDFFSIGTGVSVLGSYDLTWTSRQTLVVLGFAIVYFLQLPAKWKLSRKKWGLRLGGCVGAIVVFVSLGTDIQSDAGVNRWHLYPFLFTPTIMAERNGFFATYIMDHQYLRVEKPAGYTAEEAESLLRDSASGEKMDDTGDASPTQAERLPNIIVIMDEAFSDLAVLGDFETNVDDMPFLHAMQAGEKNTITGYLNVSVKGGNTANTEFEFLTGDTMAFLPTGSIPYQQYIRHDLNALPAYLKTLGYETTAIHPYRAAGWSRNTVYPRLGFDTMLFQDDFVSPTYVRNYISDESSFAKIIEVYEEGKDLAPQFIFNVTMQNHGGYTDAYQNLEESVTATDLSSAPLNRYLSLISLTDYALAGLVTFFENQEEPTILVFFGDHQPNDTIASVIAPEIMRSRVQDVETSTDLEKRRYLVPYLIWANFDIEGATERDTSVNYLAAETLLAAGLPLSDYLNFLTVQESRYPVLSAECAVDSNGNVFDPEDLFPELNDYRKVQYYELFDAAQN